jgi:hypothetical protein
MILFFDTFIVSRKTKSGAGSLDDKQREALINNFMDRSYTYRFQSKIDIVKYTLASYAIINWDKVIINFECEDVDDVDDFKAYCRSLFPKADITDRRSDTAQKYAVALELLKVYGNPWVFFSPNNDHAFLNRPEKFIPLINLAEKCESKFPQAAVSIAYSHFTETQNDLTPKHPLWGYYAGSIKRLLETHDFAYVETSNIALLDSVKIFRLDFLISIFKSTKKIGRVIRIEDTEFYRSKINEITVVPREELCRHYDAYLNVTDLVPPLFIPDGFFTSEIDIRYGYNEWKKGCVNINPLHYTYGEDEGCSDLLCLKKDIPYFWMGRLRTTDVNINFHDDKLILEDLHYYKVLLNPWYQNSIRKNLILSFKRLLFFIFDYRIKFHHSIFFLSWKFPHCYNFVRHIFRSIFKRKYS